MNPNGKRERESNHQNHRKSQGKVLDENYSRPGGERAEKVVNEGKGRNEEDREQHVPREQPRRSHRVRIHAGQTDGDNNGTIEEASAAAHETLGEPSAAKASESGSKEQRDWIQKR